MFDFLYGVVQAKVLQKTGRISERRLAQKPQTRRPRPSLLSIQAIDIRWILRPFGGEPRSEERQLIQNKLFPIAPRSSHQRLNR